MVIKGMEKKTATQPASRVHSLGQRLRATFNSDANQRGSHTFRYLTHQMGAAHLPTF